MEELRYSRFKDAPWFSEDSAETVVIGGAGGIGSWLTLFLARAGFNIIVYDDDIIEKHNLGGQFYRTAQVGGYKVIALHDSVYNFSGKGINSFTKKIERDMIASPFMFSGFDNMEARKLMFEIWKQKSYPVTPLFIDGRLTVDSLQVFCVTPDRIEEYEKTLFLDSEIEDEPCTLKQTTHMAAMIASHMTSFFTNHITNVRERQIIREVPFKYEYYGPVNLTL